MSPFTCDIANVHLRIYVTFNGCLLCKDEGSLYGFKWNGSYCRVLIMPSLKDMSVEMEEATRVGLLL